MNKGCGEQAKAICVGSAVERTELMQDPGRHNLETCDIVKSN